MNITETLAPILALLDDAGIDPDDVHDIGPRVEEVYLTMSGLAVLGEHLGTEPAAYMNLERWAYFQIHHGQCRYWAAADYAKLTDRQREQAEAVRASKAAPKAVA